MTNLTNLLYGTLLKKIRISRNLMQEKLANQCYLSRGTLYNFEKGKCYPHRYHREAFAIALSSPALEYFPQYRIEQFSERLKIRFQAEKEASSYLLTQLKPKDLENFHNIFNLYKAACQEENPTLMMVLDEYLHTRIMNAHPDKNIKNLIAIYRHDFIEVNAHCV